MTDCSGCKICSCYRGEDCVRGHNFESYGEPTQREYGKTENKKIMEVSTRIEGEHYMEWTRIEEIIGFARRMGYKRIGIAHCAGLTNEAKTLRDILKKNFEVHAVCCKFSGVDKKKFDLVQIKEERYEAICNSIGQAMVLNDLKTDLNITVGLCVGHDILFTQNSVAPVTTFIVKDRVTGHNPVATLYSNYYKKKFGVE